LQKLKDKLDYYEIYKKNIIEKKLVGKLN